MAKIVSIKTGYDSDWKMLISIADLQKVCSIVTLNGNAVIARHGTNKTALKKLLK